MKTTFSLLFILFFSFLGQAQEGILNYHSDITIRKDRSILVSEIISVHAYGFGGSIQRGIFRDIPNVMTDHEGNKYEVAIHIVEVLKDGSPENFSESEINNGIQLRIGNADVYLESGDYTYTITYEVSDQIRLFEEYDEIYWNAIGDQWTFSIQEGSARIHLPSGAGIVQQAAYSGDYGETECNCEHTVENDSTIYYKLNQPLSSYSAFTVAVGFDKGFVTPLTEEELQERELQRWMPVIYAISGLILVLLYYFLAWLKVGVDPDKGAVIARFEPPKGYTPAATRFVVKMGFDNKAFSASLINMAVKKFLIIDKTGNNYQLIKSSDSDSMLSAGEKKIANKIFGNSDRVTIKQSNHSKIRNGISALKDQLSSDFEKINFKKNTPWIIPGVIISIATLVVTLGTLVDQEELFFPLVGFMMASLFFGPLIFALYKKISTAKGYMKYVHGIWGIFIFGILFSVLGVASWNLAELHFININFVFYIVYFIVLFGSNGLFIYLIKAPTVHGRKIMDEIEGLKMFMEAAEKHRMNMMNPPDKTPQLFEKLLPYAIALGVENKWSEQFDDIIAKAIANNEYQPTWYRGSTLYSMHYLTRDLGSTFSNDISSSSISPQSSSSSGSGGGGFSGGGGGGGGGGGW
ncbi:MAG: DUF2207 domain-containing protein [Cyclobacteriaceae bacterium]|nr:DUF2207 domain-containing protein [Cyclobacteriaceae bacterium]